MNMNEYDESHPQVRVAKALEAIVACLEKLANPPIVWMAPADERIDELA